MKRIIAGALFMMMVLTGCTAGETAEQAMDNALKAVKAADTEGMEKYFGADIINGAEGEELVAGLGDSDEIAKSVMNKFDYKIVKVEETDAGATAELDLTNIDMAKMMGDVIGELLQEVIANPDAATSEDEMDDKVMVMFTEYLAKADAETVTNTATVTLTKQDKSWKIEPSDEFIDGIMGGMLSFIQDMGASFAG